MTLVYLARQNKAVMSVNPEAVNSDPELGLDNLSTFLPVPGPVALHENELCKWGAGGAAADRSQGYHSDGPFVGGAGIGKG